MKQFSYGMRSIFEGFFKNLKSEKNLKTYIPAFSSYSQVLLLKVKRTVRFYPNSFHS